MNSGEGQFRSSSDWGEAADAGTILTPGPSARLPAGMVLNNTFQIDAFIRSGGMGEIYKGRSIQTGDIVAIKLIRPEMAENETALALFRKEASILHKLLHKAIVRYYIFAEDPSIRRPYLVMEFVDGPSLADMIRLGPLPYESVRQLQRRLASGLQAAHELGIVHRDISPDNVILPESNVERVKIIDFGIARAANIGDTIIGDGFAGKYKYVSPEQIGLNGGDVSLKSDIYSLGLVLAEALTGEAIDMGASQAEMIDRRREVPDLRKVDARFRPLIERMLQPRPDDRPASMTEVAEWGLDPMTPKGATAVTAGVSPAPALGAPPRKKNSSGRLSFLVGVAGVAIVAAWAVSSNLRHREVEPQLAPPPVGSSTTELPPVENPPRREPPIPPQIPAQPENITPVEPEAPPPVEVTKATRISDFVTRYDGGECFYATPLAVTDNFARIEGFGTSEQPFASFYEEFKREFEVEPDIEVRPVDQAQCPAVDYLAGIRTGSQRSVEITLDSDRLRAGQPLSGSVEIGKNPPSRCCWSQRPEQSFILRIWKTRARAGKDSAMIFQGLRPARAANSCSFPSQRRSRLRV